MNAPYRFDDSDGWIVIEEGRTPAAHDVNPPEIRMAAIVRLAEASTRRSSVPRTRCLVHVRREIDARPGGVMVWR